MRKKIINLLKQSSKKPLRQKEFLNRLKLKQHQIGEAKILTKEMIKSGDIILVKLECLILIEGLSIIF